MNSKHIACLKIKFFKCHLKFIFLDKETGYTDCTANALCNIELYRDSWPISSRVGWASVIETLDLGSIPCQVKKKTIELGIHSFLAWRSTWKRDRVKPSPCVQDRYARYSLTRRLKGPFTVFWPSQLSKWSSYNYFLRPLMVLLTIKSRCKYPQFPYAFTIILRENFQLETSPAWHLCCYSGAPILDKCHWCS